MASGKSQPNLSELEDVQLTSDGNVAIVTLQRPPVNAIRTRTYQELEFVFRTIRDADDAVVIIIRSALERAFCAGADVKELPMTPELDRRRQDLARTVLEMIRHSTQPVICAIDGPALGAGCAIAACADIRVASERAMFGLPEISVGRAGSARFLMRVLPVGAVRQAFLTGRPISAVEAHRLGMVQQLVIGDGSVDSAALALAHDIGRHSPIAIRLAKESMDLAEEMAIAEGYRVEQQFSLRLAVTEDAAEAVRAAAEKRPPVWTGR